jgi:cytidine deaminase
MSAANDSELISRALLVRERAYVPYSSFKVGAALADTAGQTFVGCNVENVSYGLTICAERVALASAIAAGSTTFDVIAIVSDSAEPVVPCGACRQVLAEFTPALRVISSTVTGRTTEFSLSALLPSPRQGILG